METLYDLLGALPNDDAGLHFVARSSRLTPTSIRQTRMPDLNYAGSSTPTRFSAMSTSVRLMIISWKSRASSRSRRQSRPSRPRSTNSLPV